MTSPAGRMMQAAPPIVGDAVKPGVFLRAFVLSVFVAASLAVTALPTTNILERIGLLSLLAGLAAVAGARPVRFPGLRIEMTPTHPLILVGLGAIGPMAAALIGFAGVVGAAVGRRPLPAPLRFVFNLAAVSLSAAASAGVFLMVGGRPEQELASMIFPLAGATAAYFLANTGLVSAAIALEKRQALIHTWRVSFSWSPASYVCGLSLAVAVLAALENLSLWALVLGVPTCWVLRAFYRNHATRIVA